MSRVINTSLATIQFQVNARQANAAMQALQGASDDLNRAIERVNKQIEGLGSGAVKENPTFVALDNQLKGLKKDLKDVEKAQRDFLKGAKAADQLWKAAGEGNIESLSFRSIKAGVNGLKKRQEGLSPGDAQNMKDWRIIKEVIDEAERVMKQAGADVQNVVQTIREGGKVSEQAMRQTINTLKELKGSVDETDADFRTYGNDLDFMEAKLQEFSEAQRRTKGEIVDANDARREMNKLTEEGAAAAKREAEEADQLVQQYKAESEELVKKRNEIKANIEDAQKQIDENHKLIEEKHRQLAADEETFNAEQQGRSETIDGLKTQAEAERKLANEKSDAAETHRRAAELQKQTTEQLTEKVTDLQGKLAELNEQIAQAEQQSTTATKSEAEALKELEDAQKKLTGRKNWLSQQEGYLKEHLDVLKQIGLKEEDLADEGKVREAVEKKVLEIMQAQANVEKEVAEQQQKMIAGLKDNALGGTKADHEYYIKNKGNYELGEYATRDDVMERIAHLERLSEIKNGKRFDPYEDWEDEYDLDEDAPVMNDKEREDIKNELRILKQHVREEILKAIREAGDIDKGVENATGGDGVSEDAKFGEELNDKISALKDKIHESIKTTVESYSDLLDEDIDREIPMTKEELTSRIKGIVSYTGESLASDRRSIGWAKEDVQDAEALVAAKQKQVDAIKAGTQATADSNQQTEEELRMKGELETAQGKLAESKKRENEEQQEYVKLQGEAIEQGNKAAAAETKLADAQSEATQKQADFNQKQQEGLDAINQVAQGNQALQESIDGLNGELEQNSKDIADNANKATEAEQQKQQARQLSIQRMEEMLAVMQKEYREEELTNEQRIEHARKIQELQAALEKEKGVPVLDMMTQRMERIPQLSSAALTETKKFWQAMADGAEKGSKELATAEAHLKTITEEEAKRNRAALETSAGRLRGNLGNLSENELRQAINDAKQLQTTYKSTSTEAREMAQAIVNAEEHIKRYGVEAERAARKQEEADKKAQRAARDKQEQEYQAQQQQRQMMLERAMLERNRTSLSAQALDETKKYWKAVADGANEGSVAQHNALAIMQKLTEEETRRNTAANEKKASKLDGNLWYISEGETRDAIEAAKQLLLTYEAGNIEAKKLSEKIIQAEHHIKEYGLEAQRAAFNQKESILQMENQLRTGTQLSPSALKAQESFWQKFIDDPKNAGKSLDEYKEKLREVQDLQKELAAKTVKEEGEKAMAFFEGGIDNASANDIKQNAEALKRYRDSLPQEDEADTIKKINDYLKQAGQSAQKAAEDMMPLRNAFKIGLQGLNGTFKGSSKDLAAAKKSIEDALAGAEKGSRRYNQLQRALNGVELEMRRVKELTPEVQAVLDKPKGRSFNDLKQAIEQARQKLNSIDRTTEQGQAEFKKLAEQIKNADYEMRQLGNSSKGTANAFEQAWSRFKTYVTFYVSAAAAIQKAIATFGDLMELSDKMGEVRKTTGFTADEVGRLSDSLKKLDTRTTLTGLMDLSVAAGQLGLKTEEDVLGFTEAANKLMVALPEMGKEGATEMLKVALATGEIAKIEKQMQEGLIDGSSATAVAMEKVGSTIDRLRATSAATAPAITDFVKRVGAVGAQSGISIDQVAALGSTVDALGMRVEMSATALSRMIPAIKNNAYQIGAMIGQTEESIIRRFKNGMGMDVILDIFQSIRDNSKMMTGDVEADAESIEQAFEGAGLKEVMKELNQQGARAGIVFAGLSQNVDELRRQLGVAAEAYEENIAIELEYSKMNETAAAKWERLKNQFEEFFIGDASQRFLGGLVDVLRWVVDFITGNVTGALKGLHVAVLSLTVAWGVFKISLADGGILLLKSIKNLWTGITGLAGKVKESITLSIALRNAKRAEAAATDEVTRATAAQSVATLQAKKAQLGLNAAMKANVFLAIAAAITTAYIALKDWISGNNIAAKVVEDLNEKVDEEKRKLDSLFEAYHDANGNLKKRTNLMNEINQKYSKYLGFMLTDAENSNLVAAAHERIAAALEAEMYQRERSETTKSVRGNYKEDLSDEWSEFTDELREYGLKSEQVAQARNDIMKFLETVSWDATSDKAVFAEGTKEGIIENLKRQGAPLANLNSADANEIIAIWVNQYLERTFNLDQKALSDITGVRLIKEDSGWLNNRGGDNFRGDYAKTYINFLRQVAKANDEIDGHIANAENKRVENTRTLIDNLKQQANDAVKVITNVNSAEEDIAKAYENLASSVEGLDVLGQELKNSTKAADRTTAQGLVSFVTNLFRGNPTVSSEKTQEARTRQKSLWDRINNPEATIVGDGNGNGGPRGPYGNYDKRVAPYEEWEANALVKRREEMLMRVRALANGADVQAVLSMDKRFMDEAKRNSIKTMRDAIEWYNTERMKIQEVLHERHLTNEGQWMDPKQSRSKKPKQVYSEEAIAELDRYYAWRKEELERQRAEEGVSEAEFNRRMETMEQEHLQKRADLRRSFTTEDKKFVEQFRKWWKGVAELDKIEWELIEAEWIAALDRDRKYNDRNAQKDLAAMRAIVVKQLAAIEDIIAKERPFNGITENLETNLTKMGVLFADFDKMRRDALERGATKDEIDAINAQSDAERTKRLSWLLGMSEEAYTLTIEELMRRMAKDGMQAWADELNSNENGEAMKRALLAQLHVTYDAVQDAIKKEASQIKKQADIMWNDVASPGSSSMKQAYESAISALGLQKDSVSRANSLIGAGVASERVADRLAIKQLQIRLAMQEHYYRLVRQKGAEHIAKLEAEAAIMEKEGKLEEARIKRLDVEHAKTALNLSLSEEQKKLDEQRVAIANQLEESQNRLYTALKEWADLLSSSVREVFEASNAGNAEYYNERAKLNLTGKGGPGAGTYIVIDDAGTSDAKAHYEYLSEREALEREHEIEQQNAQAEAFRKVMDDLNAKMSEQITDSLNAMLQNGAVDANTAALKANTEVLKQLSEKTAQSAEAMTKNTDVTAKAGATPAASPVVIPAAGSDNKDKKTGTIVIEPLEHEVMPNDAPDGTQTNPLAVKVVNADGTDVVLPTVNGETAENVPAYLRRPEETQPETPSYTPEWQQPTQQQGGQQQGWQTPMMPPATEDTAMYGAPWAAMADASDKATKTITENDEKATKSSKASFAAMTAAANMYGIAYQTMANDNLSTAQKVEMLIVQAAGQAAISMLTAQLAADTGATASQAPNWVSKTLSQLGPIAGPAMVGVFTALIGGLMGLAVSKIGKSKSQIAQATGASASAGKLATGMLTYAEGNVNEFTDPATLTVGKQYNVDGRDGRTYRARYMGKGAKTHITNGPEFHLVGEAGREAIIDAKTTRLIRMNDTGIWQDIQTLYRGGSLADVMPRRRRGIRTFASGNLEDFEESYGSDGSNETTDLAAMQASLDRNSAVQEALLERLNQPIYAQNILHGADGLPNVLAKLEKEAKRHGVKYI